MKWVGVIIGCLLLFHLQVMGQTPKRYLVSDFGEERLDAVMELCHQGGFDLLLQRYPFATYGNYLWNPDFAPQGDRSVVRMVKKASDEDVALGIYVQPDAISVNDAFFAPRYHHQLLTQGEVTLFDDISVDQKDFAIYKSDVLNAPSTLNLLLIDDELISYGTMEPAGELMLLHHCTRGVFGTRPAMHRQKERTYKIADASERFVFPDGVLRDSVRAQLSERIADAGITFVEYANQPGHELLSEAQRVQQVERWTREANLSDGEPLTLGWLRIHGADRHQHSITIEDVEWFLSKATAFNAGYGLVVGKNMMQRYGQLDRVMLAAKAWDELRASGLLSDQLREALKDPYQDWHLEKDDAGRYLLYELNVSRRFRCDFEYAKTDTLSSIPWEWKSEEAGAFGIRLQVEGATAITDPIFCIGDEELRFPCSIQPFQWLLFDFDSVAYVTDADYRIVDTVVPEGCALLPKGVTEVSLSCRVAHSKRQPAVSVRYLIREKALVLDHDTQ